MSEFWHLSEVDLYSILCPTKLKEFEKSNYVNYSKGDIIYFQESSDSKIYLISKGKVKLVTYNADGEEVVKLILKKGEIFGLKSILGIDKRDDFAVAIDKETCLCPLTIDDMKSLMRKNKRFELHIYKLIGLRIKKIERRLELLVHKDVETRLVEFLRDLYEENESEEFKNPYTQEDIAKLTGTSRESISKLLNKFKRENLLEFNRRSIRLLDPDSLFDLSQK